MFLYNITIEEQFSYIIYYIILNSMTDNFINDKKEAVYQLLQGAENVVDFDLLYQGLESDGWIIHPVRFQSKIIGAIIQKGSDIHTSIAPEYQKYWNPLPYIRSILYPTLDMHGVVHSYAAKNDHRGIRWLTKLGFYQTSEDNENIYFELKEKKFK